MWSEHAARMPTQQAVRTFRHRKSVWFKGIYKTDGDKVRPDDLLVMQYDWDYHPGLNVKAITIQRDKFLRANVAGTVMITRERIDPDLNQPDMEMMYGEKLRAGMRLHKLTFNVVPDELKGRFILKHEQ